LTTVGRTTGATGSVLRSTVLLRSGAASLRWQKGTIRDLRNFGITRVTWQHWLRLLGGYLAYLIQLVCFIVIADSLLAHQRYNLAWGIGVLAVTVINRLRTSRRAGWKGLAVALLTVLELGYNIFVWYDQAQHDGIYHQDWRLEDNPAALAAFRSAVKKYG
jgi:hypothetical protein